MIPYFKKNDLQMFYKYLDKAKVYFEYGAGGSTYQASIRKNIVKMYSVESDPDWYKKVCENIQNKEKARIIYKDLNTRKNKGYPGKIPIEDCWVYSNVIKTIKANTVDLVLIDGRFRVACALKCFNNITKDAFIIFDDFLKRSYYKEVLNYYEIVEKTSDNSMVVLKKKNVAYPSDELIQKYEKIAL